MVKEPKRFFDLLSSAEFEVSNAHGERGNG